jgi:phosphoribosylamine---glycine ligase
MSASAKLNVLLIGGGGREHALAWRLSQSPRLGSLSISHPQNPGLAALGKPVDVPVAIREIYRLEQFCEKHNIGLVVIGPEEPLAEGFADKLRKPGRLVFGPGAEGARLEADKAWAKDLMRAAAVPTAEAVVFTDAEGARNYVETRAEDDDAVKNVLLAAGKYRDPADRRALIDQKRRTDRAVAAAYAKKRADLPVIKAAGLAKGKGVIVPATLAEAVDALDRIMVQRVFGAAGDRAVIEERLEGTEVSVLALVDGRSIYVLETCQDHKRLQDGDAGPNTGGMGAFCPSGTIDDTMMSRIQEQILVPTVDALKREGIDYRGVLYAGLMLTPAGPKVLEFNCRFGDPECQALMARLESDLLELILATCEGRLSEMDVAWKPGASCCVVMAAPGYPDEPRAGLPITGVDDAARLPGVTVFHAGTKRDTAGKLVTAGGRVLSVTGTGEDLPAARERAYAACDMIQFEGKQVRRDIGIKPPR